MCVATQRVVAGSWSESQLSHPNAERCKCALNLCSFSLFAPESNCYAGKNLSTSLTWLTRRSGGDTGRKERVNEGRKETLWPGSHVPDGARLVAVGEGRWIKVHNGFSFNFLNTSIRGLLHCITASTGLHI